MHFMFFEIVLFTLLTRLNDVDKAYFGIRTIKQFRIRWFPPKTRVLAVSASFLL